MTLDYEALGRAMLAGVEAGVTFPGQPFYEAEIGPDERLSILPCRSEQQSERGVVFCRVVRSRPPAQYVDIDVSMSLLRDEPATCARLVMEHAHSAMDRSDGKSG